MKTRAEALKSIEGQSFDVGVIGGGATGAGCALDSQLRGLRTVLVEAGDFACATSSTSTKMVHGGVRYLEQAIRRLDPAQFEVVNRALRERLLMLRNAPYLTGTIEFLTPCLRWLDVAYLQIGLKLYDWIAGRARLAPSHFVSRGEALRRLPGLNPDHLVGAVAYTDGQFDDARYNITLVKTFAEAGGEALNYARVVGFEKSSGGRLAAAQVEDSLSQRRFVVRASAFINATGPYADRIRGMAAPGVPPRMRLSKGVHIVLPLDVLPGHDALLIPKTQDGRVLFAIPWAGRLLVGTTDDEVTIDDELYLAKRDVEYLLRHLNRYLSRPVTPDRVVSGTTGARALVSTGDARTTKKLTRDHEIELDGASGLISILGGKWTTYRAMAEDTIDAVEKYLNNRTTGCSTKNHPLYGSGGYGPNFWRDLAKQPGLSESSARHLAGKFGARASDVIDLARQDPELAAPLVEGHAPLRAEVVFGIRDEMATSIEDVLARRIGLEIDGWREAIQAAPVVADLLAREFSWSGIAKQEALNRYVARIRNLMARAGLAPGRI
jgi:glycerol-3-phosphate dehydrogenase